MIGKGVASSSQASASCADGSKVRSRASAKTSAPEERRGKNTTPVLSAPAQATRAPALTLVKRSERADKAAACLFVCWKDVLLYYRVVHAIPGRMRLRPVKHATHTAQIRDDVRNFLSRSFKGAKVAVSKYTGSLLVCHNSGSAVLSGASASALDSEAIQPRNPVPGKIANFFIPKIFVYGLAVFRSIPYMITAFSSLLRGRLNLDALDGSALLVCLLRRDFRSLSSITFFFALGEYLSEWTRKKSRASLVESLALNIDKLWVRREGAELEIPIAELSLGEHIIVRAGSAIPVDGCVVEGEGMVNQATMTGEALPVPRMAGHSVFAGTVIEQGEIIIEATKVGGDTRISAIVRTIEESESAKASIQGRYERIADSIVPYNFLLSGAVYAATRNPMRAGSILLVDYSCAIRLATPLCIFTAMQEAAANGVLIKGGKFMEFIADADVFVFDKTGTLTSAKPQLVDVVSFGGRKRETILRLAACLEEHFVHPVGQAVVRASDAEGLKHREEHTKVEFIVAHGIASQWRGKRMLIGSAHFVLEDEKVPISGEQQAIVEEESRKGRSVLYLSIGGELAGLLLIDDTIREETHRVLDALRADGVKKVIMLTGDSSATAASIAAKAGVDEFRAHLLPEDKAKYIEELKAQGYKVAMVGDGVNDSLALSGADVGIAMAEGADMAREVADIVLTNGRLEGLLLARVLSREALRRVHSGFKTSLFWNSIFLIGGLLGVLQPGLSAFLHNATTAAIAVSSVRPMLVAGGDTTA